MENSDEEDSSNTPDQVAVKTISSAKGNEPVMIKGKVRWKHTKTEIMEVMTKTLKTVTDGFKETEMMMVELEEKKMEFEQRMRKQDHELQMEMMKMIVSHLPSPNPGPMYQPYQPPQPPGGYFDHDKL